MVSKDLTIIIPALNEELAIGATLDKLIHTRPDLKILVIDDGSTDATAAIAASKPGVQVIRHHINRGYGASIKTGVLACDTPYLLWFDADGQHRPEDIDAVVGPVIERGFDASFGARKKGSANVVKRIPGKLVLKVVSQIVARRSIPDLNCGLRCFRTSVIRRYLHILPNGFSASATSTLLMLKRGYRFEFVPIQTESRVGKSTVKIFRDGFKTLHLIMRMMLIFDAFMFFSFCAAIQIIPGLVYSLMVSTREGRGFPVLGALVIFSGFLTFFMGILSAQISEMRQERFELSVRED